MTSSRAPEEWAEVFGNPLLASAALDRLRLTGASYRQRHKRSGEKKETKRKALLFPRAPRVPVVGKTL